MRTHAKAPFDAAVQCSTCEHLLRKVNEARMHVLLAQAWSELRAKQETANTQVQDAASQLEGAYRILERHWQETHRMNC